MLTIDATIAFRCPFFGKTSPKDFHLLTRFKEKFYVYTLALLAVVPQNTGMESDGWAGDDSLQRFGDRLWQSHDQNQRRRACFWGVSRTGFTCIYRISRFWACAGHRGDSRAV